MCNHKKKDWDLNMHHTTKKNVLLHKHYNNNHVLLGCTNITPEDKTIMSTHHCRHLRRHCRPYPTSNQLLSRWLSWSTARQVDVTPSVPFTSSIDACRCHRSLNRELCRRALAKRSILIYFESCCRHSPRVHSTPQRHC